MDLDGDGRLDCAMADLANSRLSLYFGDGQGGFSLQQHYLGSYFSLNAPGRDFNKDGRRDFVFGGDSGLLTVLGTER